MQSVAAIACAWVAQRRPAAVARVIAAEGLGPRPSGDLLFVDADSRIAGALLGGVTNSEVAGAARHVLLALRVDRRSDGPNRRAARRSSSSADPARRAACTGVAARSR